MKTLSLGILLLLSNLAFSQVTDNFDDSDLLINPKWYGQLNYFNSGNKALNSFSSAANTEFYISTPSSASINSEWRIDVKLLFNTSSLNYVDLVVMSDSFDVTKMRNGYFVRLGGTSDEISLYKTKNGAEVEIIDGADNVLNSSNNQWQIILIRKYSGDFILQRKPIAGGILVAEGFALDSDIVSSSCLGLRIRQSTASFFNKHYFDNLYAGNIIKDTLAPVMDSLIVINGQQLRCVFNEQCDSIALTDVSNYKIQQGNIKPLSTIFVNDKEVKLSFQNVFVPNTPLDLITTNIADRIGNKIATSSKGFFYSKTDTASQHELLITELMPDPSPAVGLPEKEYVEISNNSSRFIQLNNCMIHDPTGSNKLPNVILAPDSIIVLYSIPSLNNAADKIWLTNQKGEIIHSVNYTDDWYKDSKKKVGGWSLEMINKNSLCIGEANWRASINKKGGTPGTVNSVNGKGLPDTKAPKIVSAIPLNDSILHLVFDKEIDSLNSGMNLFLANNLKRYFKLVKMSNDYMEAEWQIDFVPHPDSIYRFIVNDIKDCSGNAISGEFLNIQWPSISMRSDLIFNEILFNPQTGGYDFIELYNNTSKAFDLSKHFIAVMDETHQYKSIDKLSEAHLILGPYQYLLISADTVKICEAYRCINPNTLKLNFSKMPSMPDDKGNLVLVNLGGRNIDSLYYSEDWHFPLLSDKEGVSLERISFTAPTRSADNWHSASSIAGFATPGYLNSQTTATQIPDKYFSLQSKTVSPDEDGFEDLLILNYKLPGQDFITSINIYDTEGRLISEWVNNETMGTEGFITWNGIDHNIQKAGIGMYILDIESTHIDGRRIKEKMSFTVAGKF